MAYEFRLQRPIQFVDTDMAGIVHFANFFRYMEETEHAFYRSLGLAVHPRNGDRVLGWPRVRAECDYRHPLRFEDQVEIHLLVREKREKSLSYLFHFNKQTQEGTLEVAEGSLTVVCADVTQPGGRMVSVPIPAEIAAKIDVAPAELLAQS